MKRNRGSSTTKVTHYPFWVDPIVQVLWKEKRKGVFSMLVIAIPKARMKSSLESVVAIYPFTPTSSTQPYPFHRLHIENRFFFLSQSQSEPYYCNAQLLFYLRSGGFS